MNKKFCKNEECLSMHVNNLIRHESALVMCQEISIISKYINNNLCLHTVQNTFPKVFYIPCISAPIALQLRRSLTSTYCIVAGGSGKYSF